MWPDINIKKINNTEILWNNHKVWMRYCRRVRWWFGDAGAPLFPTVGSRSWALCRGVLLRGFVPPSELQKGWSRAPAASVDTQVPQSRKLILRQMCRLRAASQPYITPPSLAYFPCYPPPPPSCSPPSPTSSYSVIFSVSDGVVESIGIHKQRTALWLCLR